MNIIVKIILVLGFTAAGFFIGGHQIPSEQAALYGAAAGFSLGLLFAAPGYVTKLVGAVLSIAIVGVVGFFITQNWDDIHSVVSPQDPIHSNPTDSQSEQTLQTYEIDSELLSWEQGKRQTRCSKHEFWFNHSKGFKISDTEKLLTLIVNSSCNDSAIITVDTKTFDQRSNRLLDQRQDRVKMWPNALGVADIKVPLGHNESIIHSVDPYAPKHSNCSPDQFRSNTSRDSTNNGLLWVDLKSHCAADAWVIVRINITYDYYLSDIRYLKLRVRARGETLSEINSTSGVRNSESMIMDVL